METKTNFKWEKKESIYCMFQEGYFIVTYILTEQSICEFGSGLALTVHVFCQKKNI